MLTPHFTDRLTISTRWYRAELIVLTRRTARVCS
jgi:hypothetical protein